MEKSVFEKLEQIAVRACELRDVSLYDLEVKTASKGLIILVYVTTPNGVTVGNCQKVSKLIANVLEVEDLIEEKYFLEVSSPGIERYLKLKKHYDSAIGELAKITFNTGEENSTVIGKILEILPEVVKMEVDDEEIEISFSSIKKAKTYFEYKSKEREVL